MQNIKPIISASIASSKPPNIIHNKLSRQDDAPPLYSISLPNGKNDMDASLKH
jgi:hypothetical protein